LFVFAIFNDFLSLSTWKLMVQKIDLRRNEVNTDLSIAKGIKGFFCVLLSFPISFIFFLKPWININCNEWAHRPGYDVWMQCPLYGVNAVIENYRLRIEIPFYRD